ncbi:telomere length regulation protein-domain-containing protein [Phakopsora pachyrhizi]|uniref:Telomere length regulation protein-domain-containing protein n=1 Tax=Phakopsora pachyrhizi TaxID=170000 RepID=A0AAV0AQ40_PHAPC|nr:telomere length regulation protein-domain-containing protein [Phakopsora pachyrhizi]CAH7669946.1 telomere length regulation protein-domain-containing protein [Phakopsora pachyrhizi]
MSSSLVDGDPIGQFIDFNRLIRSINSERFESLDKLLKAVLPPLIRIGLVGRDDLPSSGPFYKVLVEIFESEGKIGSTVESDQSFWFRHLPRVQSVLLHRVIVDWKSSLLENGLWESAFCIWFGIDGFKNSGSRSRLAKVALETLTGFLSKDSLNSSNIHPEMIVTVYEMLDRILERYSLRDLWDSCGHSPSHCGPSSIRQETDWRQLINALFSIPDKVSNSSILLECANIFFSFSSSFSFFFFRSLLSRTSVQFESFIDHISRSNCSLENLNHLVILLSKFINNGFVVVNSLANERSGVTERAGAEIFRFFLSDWAEEETEDSSFEISGVVMEVVTLREGWSIGTARCISRWTLMGPNHKFPRARIAKEALSSFGNRDQITYGSTSHHVFLLVLLLLTACPTGPGEKFSNFGSELDISIDPKIVEAVQLSLASLRRQFRLLGMLMAELVTSLHQMGEKGFEKLDFGQQIWSVDDQETRLCHKIRELSRDWWKSLDSSDDKKWIDYLSRLIDDRIEVKLEETKTDESNKICPPTEELQSNKLHKYLVDTTKSSTLDHIRGINSKVPLVTRPKIEILNSFGEPKGEKDSDEDDDEFEPYEPPLDDQLFKGEAKAYDLSRKKIRKPVFISELSEYLRKDDSYDYTAVGLFEAEDLIRRKRGWGTELEENALDLTFALLCMQDNYEMENFERLRQNALCALVVSVPQKVGPCLVEQVFFNQYSYTQRVCILNSIVLGAREILLSSSSKKKGGKDGFLFPSRMIPSSETHKLLMSFQTNQIESDRFDGKCSGQLSDLISEVSLNRVDSGTGKSIINNNCQDNKEQGRDSATSSKTKISKSLERRRNELEALSKLDTRPRIDYKEWFLIPLVSQVWNYLNQSDRLSLTGRSSSVKPYLGSGYSILSEPLMINKLIETLTSLIGNVIFISNSISHEDSNGLNLLMIEVMYIGIRIKRGIDYRGGDSGEGIGSEMMIEGSILGMILICLESLSEEGDDRLIRGSEDLILVVIDWCQKILEETKGDRDEDLIGKFLSKRNRTDFEVKRSGGALVDPESSGDGSGGRGDVNCKARSRLKLAIAILSKIKEKTSS